MVDYKLQKGALGSVARATHDKLDTPYQELAQSGLAVLTDLLAQNLNVIVAVQEEVRRIEVRQELDSEQGGDKKEHGSPISVRAFKSSIILLQFSFLEALANVLAGLQIKTMEGISGAPEITSSLTQVELDYLSEQRTSVDDKTGALKVNSRVFISTLEKLAIVPLLLGKLHGCPFRLDKNCKGWQSVQHLKETRDKLVHFKLDDTWRQLDADSPLNLDNIKPTVTIQTKDLFAGGLALRWYVQQIKVLLKQIYKDNQEPLLLHFTMLELICWMMLMNLYEDCGISENKFNQEYPMPKGINVK